MKCRSPGMPKSETGYSVVPESQELAMASRMLSFSNRCQKTMISFDANGWANGVILV
jgi:hypothetical protein